MNHTIYYLTNARLPTVRVHSLQIMKTCEALAANGLPVEIIAPRRTAADIRDIYVYYEIGKPFPIRRLRSPTLSFLGRGRLRFLARQISFALIAGFHIKTEKPILYSRDELILLIACIFKKSAAMVYEAHSNRFNIVVRLVARRADMIVTTTNNLKRFYVSQGFAPERIIVAPNGVDMDAMSCVLTHQEARQKFSFDMFERGSVALYTGQLYKWKGVHTLADAARVLDETETGFEIVLVGGSDHDIESFRKQYATYSNLHIRGRKPHEEIPCLLVAADVLVLPNIPVTEESELYTAPVKLFEYMTSGVPIIASDLPSIREVLNETNAFLVPPGDAEALARMIRYVGLYPDEAYRKAQQALEDVAQYTWTERAQTIKKSLEHIVA